MTDPSYAAIIKSASQQIPTYEYIGELLDCPTALSLFEPRVLIRATLNEPDTDPCRNNEGRIAVADTQRHALGIIGRAKCAALHILPLSLEDGILTVAHETGSPEIKRELLRHTRMEVRVQTMPATRYCEATQTATRREGRPD